jgi:hypothetical protein
MRQSAALLALAFLAACYAAQRAELPPLVEAVRNGDAPANRSLVEKGADPNAPAGGNGWTPLQHAIHTNRIDSVEALLAVGAAVDGEDSRGTTPLMMAAGYGYTPIVKLLLGRGASPRKRDHGGETALDYALAGANDIDRLTFFDCQDPTVQLLHAAAPEVRAGRAALRWASMKRCETVALVR